MIIAAPCVTMHAGCCIILYLYWYNLSCKHNKLNTQRYASDFRKVNMIYFKINDTDYSNYVSGLTVTKNANYNGLTNAAGDTVVDFLNQKRTIDVVIIPLDVAKLTRYLKM